MGITEFLSVCLFTLAVVIVAYAAFWLVSKIGLTPPAQKIAVIVIAVVGLAVLALRFAGGVLPK
jgi:hypothetical protein